MSDNEKYVTTVKDGELALKMISMSGDIVQSSENDKKKYITTLVKTQNGTELCLKVTDLGGGGGGGYVLPPATAETLGGVKVGQNLSVEADGTLNATGVGSGKNIGEVYFSESDSAQDNPGGLPLFTGETIANADNLYPQFYQWVATHSALQISTADYETAITTYGECPKYVIDTTNKTIRLPKLTNYVKMANTTDGITQSVAGLPNITGSTDAANIGNNYGTTGGNGAIKNSIYQISDTGVSNGSGQHGNIIEFDASWSNSIYGNSNTVTPAHTTLYPWVCAYNAAVPASTAQAAQFQQALTGKADTNLSNVTGTSGFRKLVEVYNNGASWYKVYDEYDPVTGAFIGKWCEQGGISPFSNYVITINLLKTYRDTNYSLLITPWDWSQNPSEWISGGLKYVDSFEIRSTTPYEMNAAWRTEGYLAIQ